MKLLFSIATLFFVTIKSILATKVSKDNVVFIVEMARHGYRAPLETVTERPWITETGPGELTTVGQRQRYNLGRQTKNRYPNFFNKRFQANEWWVRSTFFNRTIMSAVSHIQGLFDMVDADVQVPFDNDDMRLRPPQDMINPPTKEGFKTPLPAGIIPFPVHSRLGVDREMWSFGACPKAEQIRIKTLDDYSETLSKSDTFMSMFKESLTKLKASEDWEIKKPLATRCFELADFFIMDNKNSNDPTLPDKDYDKAALLKRCYDLTIIGTYKDMDVAKVTVTPILNQIVKYFEKKTNNDESKRIPLKYVQYSGHDDTIAAHLRTYGLVEPDCVENILTTGVDDLKCAHHPYTSSNLVWELIEKINDTEEYGVKFSYNGDYFDYCGNNQKDKNGDFYCTLAQFNDRVANTYTKKWDDFCPVSPTPGPTPGPKPDPKPEPSNNNIVYILIAFISILLVAVVILGIKIAKLNSTKSTVSPLKIAKPLT